MFSICSLHLEMLQESEDAIRPRMYRWPGGEMMVNLDLVVPAVSSATVNLRATYWLHNRGTVRLL